MIRTTPNRFNSTFSPSPAFTSSTSSTSSVSSPPPSVPPSGPEPEPVQISLPLEPQEPPMHLYVCSNPSVPTASAPARPCPGPDRDSSAALIQMLEQLTAQNQLLVELLGAVNGLTAAILCQKP